MFSQTSGLKLSVLSLLKLIGDHLVANFPLEFQGDRSNKNVECVKALQCMIILEMHIMIGTTNALGAF